MKLFLEIVIVSLLFIGPPIGTLMGWSDYKEVSMLKSVHPIFYFLLLYVVIKFKNFVSDKMHFNNTIVVLLIIISARIFTGEFFFARIVGNLMVPLLFSFYMKELSKSKKAFKICLSLFLALFSIEICLAIFERVDHFLLFPYSLYNPDDINGILDGDYFRSNSLLGHPLSNALCVSVILSFIVVSNIKNALKYSLILISFLSLLCFNARFAFLISSLFFTIYYLSSNFSLKKTLLITIGGLAIFYLISNFNFGDRLFSQKVSSDDTSIAARIDIFELVKKLDSDLLFFSKGSGISEVQKRYSFEHVENWVLIMVFDLGILFTVYYVYMILRLVNISLKSYKLNDKVYIFMVFILIASSNNSLATQVPALSFLIASSYFFYSKRD